MNVQASSNGDNWLFSRRILLMIPNGRSVRRLPKQPHESVTVDLRLFRQPTRKDVLGAVARTCRYPRCLMTDEPAAVVKLLDARGTAAALAGRRTMRLSTSFGLFRNRTSRARAAECD